MNFDSVMRRVLNTDFTDYADYISRRGFSFGFRGA